MFMFVFTGIVTIASASLGERRMVWRSARPSSEQPKAAHSLAPLAGGELGGLGARGLGEAAGEAWGRLGMRPDCGHRPMPLGAVLGPFWDVLEPLGGKGFLHENMKT